MIFPEVAGMEKSGTGWPNVGVLMGNSGWVVVRGDACIIAASLDEFTSA